ARSRSWVPSDESEEVLRIAQRKCRSFPYGIRSPACSFYSLRRAFVSLTRPNREVSGWWKTTSPNLGRWRTAHDHVNRSDPKYHLGSRCRRRAEQGGQGGTGALAGHLDTGRPRAGREEGQRGGAEDPRRQTHPEGQPFHLHEPGRRGWQTRHVQD